MPLFQTYGVQLVICLINYVFSSFPKAIILLSEECCDEFYRHAALESGN
jgi:hypothetical protein